jgi:rRNA processing protein Gar1
LRRIGQVIHISPSGKAVVKAERTPKIGETVLDEKNRQVGKVLDILGPTVSPYVEVDIDIENPHTFVGNFLYFPSSQKYGKRSRKR